jgi:hypothetical protein
MAMFSLTDLIVPSLEMTLVRAIGNRQQVAEVLIQS